MRIAYLNHTYPPMVTGVSHAVNQLAEGMSARGHTVRVLAASDKGTPYSTNKPGLEITRLRSYTNPLATSQRFMLWPKQEINDSLAAFSPDIIHIHDPVLLFVGRRHYRNLPYAPRVFTAHINPQVVQFYSSRIPGIKTLIERGSRLYSRWMVAYCETIIAPSHSIGEIVKEIGNKDPRIISNGIDLSIFNPLPNSQGEASGIRKKYGLNLDKPVILHVGRLSREKSVDKVVQAAAILMKKVDAQLLIVGDGPEYKNLVQFSKQLKINNQALFPGFVSCSGDLPALYRMATVFMTASAFEAQGLVLLEAAASGKPIVAVHSGAAPEIVRDGLNGYLVETGDIYGLANAAEKILTRPNETVRMGRNSRVFAEAHSIENTLIAHERLYREVITEYAVSRSLVLRSRTDQPKRSINELRE